MANVPNLDEILAETAKQLDPSLAQLEDVLGEPLDAGAFAMGMLAAAFAMTGMDTNEVVRERSAQFVRFVAACRERMAKDLGPYLPGRLLGDYGITGGTVFPAGTDVRMRKVNDKWTEIELPGGTVRWVASSWVKTLE